MGCGIGPLSLPSQFQTKLGLLAARARVTFPKLDPPTCCRGSWIVRGSSEGDSALLWTPYAPPPGLLCHREYNATSAGDVAEG
jgi:hypothetical protein